MPAEMGRFSFLDPSPQALDLSAANTAKNMPDPVFFTSCPTPFGHLSKDLFGNKCRSVYFRILK